MKFSIFLRIFVVFQVSSYSRTKDRPLGFEQITVEFVDVKEWFLEILTAILAFFGKTCNFLTFAIIQVFQNPGAKKPLRGLDKKVLKNFLWPKKLVLDFLISQSLSTF